MRVLLVCDRSAGHIFPALSVGKSIKERSQNLPKSLDLKKNPSCQDEVYFFATSDFLRNYLENEGFLVYGRPFRRRNIILEAFYRFFEAINLLFKLRPQKVIGFGGRDSLFLLLFGSFLFLDTAIYEPNITFGKANRVLSFFVRRIFCGFPDTAINGKVNPFDTPRAKGRGVLRIDGERSPEFVGPSDKSSGFNPEHNRRVEGRSRTIKSVGIPLRENIKFIEKEQALMALGFSNKPVIFCFGGSQGSHFLNSIFMELVESLEEDYQIIHLTGKREYFQISQFYNKIEKKSFVKDFYYAMEMLYSASDAVVCRAGASTLAELTYYAMPAILIPHPAAGGHQKENAFYLAKRGAAQVILQEEFSFRAFKSAVEKILHDRGERERMRQNLNRIKLGVNFEEFCNNTYF